MLSYDDDNQDDNDNEDNDDNDNDADDDQDDDQFQVWELGDEVSSDPGRMKEPLSVGLVYNLSCTNVLSSCKTYHQMYYLEQNLSSNEFLHAKPIIKYIILGKTYHQMYFLSGAKLISNCKCANVWTILCIVHQSYHQIC